MKNILFATSEAVPFIKTGGLADVAGALPKCFDKRYFDIRVILPKYTCISEEWKSKMEYITNFYMDLGFRSCYVGIFRLEYNGILFYFIDNEYYFSGPKPYDQAPWDLEKFAFFSKAVLSVLPVIDFRPHIIHCHDWQTGLVPVYLHDTFQQGEFFRGIKTIMTIHNLKFQGVWDVATVKGITGLPAYYFTADKLEAYKDANYLKGGIVYADAITTVSNTYAEEIKTAFYGEKLNGLLCARSNSLRGIVNGIDYEEYNPETDSFIVKNYNAKTFRKEKIKNKIELQKELGLEEDPKKMMIGIVSRLTDQKGFDLIAYIMDELCQDAVQLVILGTGEERYENMFRHFDWKYRGKVSANIYYSEPMSHKIYASCDAFLMPSLFEPCGLSQLMSLRYGTIPIVRETGGLKDTVQPYNEFESTGTGFSFTNYNAHEMLGVIRNAERIYYDKKREWNKIVDRAMAMDFSWHNSARQYEEMYNWMIGE
ncbi:MAG: glycogen synthase GlgA [Lachnospiraceae bacterium]|jgi:starch synthase|nr:glycogen synthase GlgA [Lachnospiraceae bacterium]MCI9100567.1 glycogen synthase GlgA [Lachnospiraceae bacterium]MCI9356067.1 glycogen synthase GlgA [Lachnospiraceae bacterium]